MNRKRSILPAAEAAGLTSWSSFRLLMRKQGQRCWSITLPVPVEDVLDVSGIAAVLDGYSASDIKLLAVEAAHLALDRSALISTEILLDAMRRVPASITPEQVDRFSAFRGRGI